MNSPSPSPTPSPLVPQGAIAPKNTSRSARVLLIGLTVALLHVAGLSVVLLQGCQKDNTKNNAAADTNTTTGPLTLPTIGESNSTQSAYYTTSNVPSPAVSVTSTPPVSVAASTQAPPATFQPPVVTQPVTDIPPAVSSEPTGPEKDYKVAAGDNLSRIAAKNKVTVTALLKANPSIDPKKLKVGQVIKVPAPVAKPVAPAAPTATASTVPTSSATPSAPIAAATAGGTYKVKPGDNLTKIAKAHGITVNQLKAANNIKTTQIVVGRVLKIPTASHATTASAPTNTTAQ